MLVVKYLLDILIILTGAGTLLLLFYGTIKTSVFIIVFLHELGHALFAKMGGIQIDHVCIGICEHDVFTMSIFGIPFRFGKVPLFEKNRPAGFVKHNDTRAKVSSYLIYSLGGVIFTITYSIIGFLSVYYFWKAPDGNLVYYVLWCIYVFPFSLAAIIDINNLLPFGKRDGRHFRLLLSLYIKGVKTIVYHTKPLPMWYNDGERIVNFEVLPTRNIIDTLFTVFLFLCLEPVFVKITHGAFNPIVMLQTFYKLW